jgi:ceroid-lipofuscinosis MFS transporter 7
MYGIILSSFSFSAFVFKPILGYWCDAKMCFREPYLTSLAVACVGGIVYFSAGAFPWSSNTSLALILLGRLMGGVGQANSTLGFTYVAQVVEKSALTQASAILSMVRILGMVIAPGLNVFLKECNATLSLGRLTLTLTPLNTVGLVLGLGNVFAFLIIYFFLHEPEMKGASKADDKDTLATTESSSKTKEEGFWESFLSLEIFVPLLSVFSLNANFQLMETGMAPVASDALGWTTVTISVVFGMNSLLIFFAIVLTFYLANKGVSNETLLSWGLVISAIGYALMYFMWTNPTTPLNFVLPVILSTMCFPFLGSPTRAIYTMVVDSKPRLRGSQGTMQAIMSMVVSIAGFTTPGIISSFILRTPEEVEDSTDGREFTPIALFAPLLSCTVLVGHLYTQWSKQNLASAKEEGDKIADETTTLLDDSAFQKWSRKYYRIPSFNPKTHARRRESVVIMGIPQIGYDDYQEAEAHVSMRQSTGSIPSIHGSAHNGSSRKSFFL